MRLTLLLQSKPVARLLGFFAQLGEAHGGGVDAIAVGVVKLFGDALGVGPFHDACPCKQMLIRLKSGKL